MNALGHLPTATPSYRTPHPFIAPGDPDKRGCVRCGMNADAPCHRTDEAREAVIKAAQGHYPDGSPHEDYCP
jgi:hypothetical protein